MTQLNSLNIVGRLVRDPELSSISSGTSLCKFGVAVSLGYGDKEKAGFFDVTAWGKTAEFVGNYFSKGKEILIEGSLDFQQWEKDGEKRSKVCITAYKCGFVGSKADQSEYTDTTPKSGDEGRINQTAETRQNAIKESISSDDVPF